MMKMGWVRALVVATAAVSAVAGGCTRKTSDAVIRSIPPTDAYKRMADNPDRVLVLDTRSEEAFQAERLSGAKHIRSSDIDVREPGKRFDGYSMVLVYGENAGSTMAAATAKKLIAAGIDSVRVIEGGFAAWRSNGLPVDAPAGE